MKPVFEATVREELITRIQSLTLQNNAHGARWMLLKYWSIAGCVMICFTGRSSVFLSGYRLDLTIEKSFESGPCIWKKTSTSLLL